MTSLILKAFIFFFVFSSSSKFINSTILQEPFDILSDVNVDDTQKIDSYQTSDDGDKSFPNCSIYMTENDYSVLENGTLLITKSNRTYGSESYYLRNDTAYFCKDDVDELITKPSYNFSEEFTHCRKILMEPNEYSILQNNSIHIGIYSKTYGPMDYYIVNKGAYICLPAYEKLKQKPSDWHKFSKVSDYVTVVGLLISIVSLMSHLVVFCLVPSVRNLPGCCLASLSLSLLMAYVCFLVAFLLETEDFCAGLGMCVYYFFLTSFFWMNAISFDVWRSFRVVMRELRISSHRLPRRRFLLYSLYCWAVPALFTILVKVFDSTNFLPEDFRPSFGHQFCWFGQRKALLLFFAVPLIIVMLLNVAFFVDVIYVINRATIKKTTAHDTNLKKRFIMFTRLALIMGLTWIFGIAAGFADNPVLWYIFIIFNTLQGLFIFAVFMGSSKVRSMCFKQYKKRGKRTSTSVRTISAAL